MTILLSILQAAAPQATAAGQGIGAGALAFMLVSMGAVASLTIWCFARVLSTRKHFDPDGTGPARPPVSGEADSR